MRTLKVAAVSMNGYLGEPERVLNEIDHWCERARAEDAELILFPELVVHGHCTPNTWGLAESVPDGSTVRCLERLAKKYNQMLCVGLSEKDRDIVYNTQVLVGPDGYIGKQRKLHMSRDESLIYKGGRDLSVFDIGSCKVGIVICYDNTFPEVARVLALRGGDVLLMPHAARMKMWEDTGASREAARRFTHAGFMRYAMRAFENACFAVLADQVGRAGYVDQYLRDSPLQPHHAGAAMVFGPNGRLLASASEDMIREEMIVATLDQAVLFEERASASYPLRVRRPELFSELVREQVSS